jgi:2-succinyl-5-enolpyruvyl-6-hydroxy-3-cyclohexene-1-carboxylate synthase
MLWGRLIAEELARAGVGAVAISPGSRSGPIALACAAEPGLRTLVHLDERAAGFLALGYARASRAPAAVLCTSGTAAANLLPAVVEAHHARVPLVVLTADRPPELRGCGAPQAIDQTKLFGAFARAFAELPVPEPDGAVLRAARAAVCRLVAAAAGPPAGPVHGNVPLREPLDPRPVPGDIPEDLEARDPLAARGRGRAPFARIVRADAPRAGAAAERLAARATESPRGIVVAGPEDRTPGLAAGIAAFARASGYPVLADPCSPLRAGAPEGVAALAAYDAFLRSERFAAAHAPDLVVRFGGVPTSKALGRYLERHAAAAHVIVDADGLLEDPSHLGAEVLRADPDALGTEAARALGRPVAEAGFVAGFLRAEARARGALDEAARGAWFEAGLVRALDAALPAGAVLFASSSMPVRELDAFLPARPRPLRVLANRGAAGIDGVLSSAIGAVLGAGAPGALLIGDLALLHDAGALLLARRERVPIAIVAIHNDGGGIFEHLPIREHAAARFEALFATPHGLDFRPLAELYGIEYARVDGPAFAEAIARALAAGGPSLLEVRLPRERSAALHRVAWEAAVRAVDES